MRDDFPSVFTGGRGLRYPFARSVRERIRDEDGNAIPGSRPYRRLERSWREGWCYRYRPIERFLRAQIGRPWDRIRGEMVRALGDAVCRDEVLQHADFLIGAGRLGRSSRGRGADGGQAGLFVDPQGILRDNPSLGYRDWSVRRAQAHLLDPGHVRLGEGHGFDRIDGVWYETRWLELAVGALASDLDPCGIRRALVFKRQLSSIEIERHGLREWPDLVSAFGASIRNRSYDRGLKLRMEKAAERSARQLAKEGAR